MQAKPLTKKQIAQRRAAGYARLAQAGADELRRIGREGGRLGGRPPWQQELESARQRQAEVSRKAGRQNKEE